MFGWMGKILEVDLSSRKTATIDTEPYARDYIGGRAMSARIAWERIPAGIDAYAPDNRIIIMTGPLTGTLSPTSGRTVMSAISPRSYPLPWYTHSTIGGWFGAQLKYAGFDGVVIGGRAEAPVYLRIQDNSIDILDASDLWGKDARQTQLELKEREGQNTQVLTIGPAGENLVRFATVQHSEENAAGHSGFGAVWGSKNLKAVTVYGTEAVEVADSHALLHEVLETRKRRYSNFLGFLFDKGEHEHSACSQACAFDCYGSFYAKLPEGRRVPVNCIGALWTRFRSMRNTQYSGGGVTIPPAKSFEQAVEAPLHELCNSLGLDLWFRVVMQPWFIRCKQLGIDRIRGHGFDPEDPSWLETLMRQLAGREGIGDIFAEDMCRAMDELEGELPEELISLGREMEFNFGFPAHREGRFWDKEPLPFWIISAMMHISTSRDPAIGSHLSSLLLAELLLRDQERSPRRFRKLGSMVWGQPDALEPTFEGKATVTIWSQHQHMLIDSLTMCDFAFPQLIKPIDSWEQWEQAEDILGDLDIDLRLLAAVTGKSLDREQLMKAAARGFNLERMLLARAGRSRKLEERLASHFQLPNRTDGTLIDQEGFLRLMDEYFLARGWDLELGWPETTTLDALGLEEAVPELDRLRINIAN